MSDTLSGGTERDQAIQDIQTIKSFLEQGQQRLEDSGFHFIVWGLLIPAGFIGFSLLAPVFGYASLFARLFWPVLCGFGAAVSLVAGFLSSRNAARPHYADSISTSLWVGNLVAVAVLFTVLFLSATGITGFFLASVAVVLGLAYWVYGSIVSLRWFSLVALPWWAAALVISLVPLQRAGIVLAVATFVCSFIPGCVLLYCRKRGNR